MIELATIFTNRTIGKNASIVLGTPIYLGGYGPDSIFWADISASGGGNVGVTFQIGDTSTETFYTPTNATIVNSFKSSIGNASRDRVAAGIVGTKWVKFKAKELNASPVTLNMHLVSAKTLIPGLARNVAASDFLFSMVLSSDHISPATGKTITGQISKDGDAFATLTNSITEIGSGLYKVDITQTEMNADVVALKFTATGADQRLIIVYTT